jgi:carbon monoxide dehydrogenase subunit G
LHLEGQFVIDMPRDLVYDFLTDPRKVSVHMPDVKDVQVEDDDHFTVTARVGISHIKGTMVMKLTIADRQPPVGTTVIGKGSGLASVVDMTTSFTLEEDEAGRTVVHWRGDVNIAGKLASFGPQGLLDRMARKNVDAFIDGIRDGLGGARHASGSEK